MRSLVPQPYLWTARGDKYSLCVGNYDDDVAVAVVGGRERRGGGGGRRWPGITSLMCVCAVHKLCALLSAICQQQQRTQRMGGRQSTLVQSSPSSTGSLSFNVSSPAPILLFPIYFANFRFGAEDW